MKQTVDIVITIYNPDSKLDELLAGLFGQTHKPGRIILMLTESAVFGRKELEERLGRLKDSLTVPCDTEIMIRCLTVQEFDHGATRHLASGFSDAEFLIYMTQDAIPADAYLVERLLEPFSDPQVSAAYARQLPYETDGGIETYTHEFNYPSESRKKTKEDIKELGIKTYFCSDVCAVYRSEVYRKMGGFVRRTIFNEDMLMAAAMIQAGYAVYYAAQARVYHSHQYTAKQQFKRNFDLGVSHRQYASVLRSVRSESEGIRLVKNTAKYLIEKGKWPELPSLFLHSACKYAGYWLGTHYEDLPQRVIKACSMCGHYWK